MRRAVRSLARFGPVLVGVALAIPPAALGQQSGTDGLDAVEAAADRGDLKAARAGLATYLEGVGEGESVSPADPDTRTRLDFLVGRLAPDPDSAEVAYLRAAIDGEGAYASRARLRLAQLQL
ncbi:MAG: hypothetical protein ACODAB_02435, partial [Gemmatimonadota bacterium]